MTTKKPRKPRAKATPFVPLLRLPKMTESGVYVPQVGDLLLSNMTWPEGSTRKGGRLLIKLDSLLPDNRTYKVKYVRSVSGDTPSEEVQAMINLGTTRLEGRAHPFGAVVNKLRRNLNEYKTKPLQVGEKVYIVDMARVRFVSGVHVGHTAVIESLNNGKESHHVTLQVTGVGTQVCHPSQLSRIKPRHAPVPF